MLILLHTDTVHSMLYNYKTKSVIIAQAHYESKETLTSSEGDEEMAEKEGEKFLEKSCPAVQILEFKGYTNIQLVEKEGEKFLEKSHPPVQILEFNTTYN